MRREVLVFKSKFKTVAAVISLALLLTACDSDTRAMTYKARVNRDYKVAGSISFISTPENTTYRNAITPIDRPIAIQSITYTFNAGTCKLDNFTVTLATSPSTPSFYVTTVVFSEVKFANFPYVDFSLNSSIRDWSGTAFNFGSVSNTSLQLPCVDPGTYLASSGTFARSVASDIYGADRWTDLERAQFVSNIHPDDLGYLWAIYGSKDNLQDSEVPFEIRETLSDLFSDSVFNNYPSALQPKGEFAKDLRSIDGVNAYIDGDNRHVVEFSFENMDPQDIQGVEWDDNTMLFPSVGKVGSKLCFNVKYGRFRDQEDTDITNDPITSTRSAAENSTDIRHEFGVDGILTYGYGSVKAKSHTMYLYLRGWGDSLDYYATELTTAPNAELNPPVCVIPGDIYKYATESKTLTNAHKTKIKKNLPRYKASDRIELSYLVNYSLRGSLSNREFNAYFKFLLKRAKEMKKYLVSLGVKKGNIRFNDQPSNDWNPRANKGSLNRVVISVLQ